MKKNLSPIRLSWRIGVGMYESDDSYQRLESFLLDYTGVVDEVAFFETITHHLYFPLGVFERRAEILRGRIQSLKRARINSVGINVLGTIGHLNEGWDRTWRGHSLHT